MGARPLRRVIQLDIEDQLSDDLLSGKFKDGETIWVEVDEEGNFYLTNNLDEKEHTPEALGMGV